MKVPAFLHLVALATMSSSPPVLAQSTTAPQAAPSIPPGETPPEAARDPQEKDDAATPGKSKQAKPAPNGDPPRSETR